MEYNLDKFNSLISIMDTFHDEAVCKDYLMHQRWPDGDYICPKCGAHHCTHRKDGRFICKHCRMIFSVLVGTIFENTKVPLRKWFVAMYQMSEHRKGISSHQIARDCNVTQKTGWYMLQRIRTLFSQDEEVIILDENVECDEAYIGGQSKYKHADKKVEGTQGRSLKTKSAVFGMVKRGGETEEEQKGPKGGKVIAKHTEDVQGETLGKLIRMHVKPGSRIFTDEYVGYNTLVESEYSHAVVNHGAKQFVDGENHTNTIEGFWSHLKRAIFGTYHWVSKTYLQRYVDEAAFRYNTCTQQEANRFRTMFERSAKVIRYGDVRITKAA